MQIPARPFGLHRGANRLRTPFILGFVLLLVVVGGLAWARHASGQSSQARHTRLLRSPADVSQEPKYRPNEVLVRFKSGVSIERIQAAHSSVQATVTGESKVVDRLQFVRLPEGASVEEAVQAYRNNSNVLYAEPNYIVHIAVQPNDPQFTSQWNLHNTGQSGGIPGSDIHATQAWDITTGSSNVVVAVLDTGVDYNHQDLAANVWTAPNAFSVTTLTATVNCAAGSRGFNVVANSCDPMDDNDHGSHVSGIIGAVGNNAVGVAGVNWNVQILPCKFLDLNGNGDTAAAIICLGLIKQLKDSGINIVATNNSWGGGFFSQALQDAISAQMQDGILFIAAAGNNFLDNDVIPFYPASYPVPNIISVAATTRTDDLAAFSDDGRRTVHIGAPGDEILSTTPNNTYSVFSGTSMAAPHVTGVVALLKAHNPSNDWRAIKNLILAGGDSNAALAETISQKRLNAFGSLTCTNSSVFSRVSPIADIISGSVGTPITLSALNINCANPAGNVAVQISPGAQAVTLLDDGAGRDLATGDGVYTGTWTPQIPGSYSLTFPDASISRVEVLQPYGFTSTNFNYVNIAGTNLNLGDDSVSEISPPFPISFGGGTFSQLFISSNGTISFTDAFASFVNSSNFFGESVPPTTLVAPFWQDLYPIKGTNQNVFWEITGTAPTRQLVVEWRNVRSFQCRSDNSATITFEVVFKEGSSDILFNYGDTQFGGACTNQDFGGQANIEVQIAPNNATSWSFDRAKTASGTALLWQSPPATLPTNPVPVLSSISPATTVWNGPSFPLTVTGTGFVPSSLVQWNGGDRATNFISSTQLVASIPATDIAVFSFTSSTNPVNITVRNPAPGGGISNGLPLLVQSPAPVINSLSPTGATAGGLSFILNVFGTGFVGQQSSVTWNGTSIGGSVITPTQMSVGIPYTLITNSGTAQVAVHTNSPGGGTSNNFPFVISPAQPAPLPGSTKQQRWDPSGNQILNQPPPRPMKFMGWNYARSQGPAYLQRFSRSYGGSIPLPPPTTTVRQADTNGRNSPVSPLSNSSTTSNLPGFALRPTIPAGFIPTSVATGDFNHDGKMDWVVANGGTNDLWIYLGNGDGTSRLPTTIPLKGSSPVWVVAADLRKNGIVDLVVAEADSGTIGVLLGNGDGTFGPEKTYFVPGSPISLAVADFDGDGKPDIVAGIIGDANTGPVAFFKGDGTGNFGHVITHPTTEGVSNYVTATLSVADLNGDGLPDLVVVDEGGNEVFAGVVAYLSNGDGTFKLSQHVAQDGPFAFLSNAVAGDMNGDGCPDIVAIHLDGGALLFTGNCDGTFQDFPAVFSIGAGDASVGLALADMNGDGHLDVITSGVRLDVSPVFGVEAGNLVTVLFGDGKGNLSQPQVYRGDPSMYSLAIADLNGDGFPEVVTANQDTDSASVFLNDGHGGFGFPSGRYIGYQTGPAEGGASNAPYRFPLVADIDGDGKPDLAQIEFQQFANFPWDIAVMLNDGTGKFGNAIRSSVSDLTPQDYILADFRKSGHPDLLILGRPATADFGMNPSLVYSQNQGGGHFGPPHTTSINLSSGAIMNVGDFDGDGKLDLVIVGEAQSSDGSKAAITFFKGNGDGTFQQGVTQNFAGDVQRFTDPRLMFVGDFNKDGKLDVLVWVYDNIIGTLNHNLYELLGNGDGTFQPAKLVIPNLGFFTVADINHDGLPDIIAYNEPLNTNENLSLVGFDIYLGQPDGTFHKTQTYQPYAGLFNFYTFANDSTRENFSPMVADFNGDGNLDIAAFQVFGIGGGGRTYAQILLGNGDGTFTPTFVPINFDKVPVPFITADLNGDGRADLVEMNGWPASFHFIPGTQGPSFQAQVVGNPVVGAHGNLRITLNAIAGNATSVQLLASDPHIAIASSASVPAGSISTDVPFTIGSGFPSLNVFSIRATSGSETSTAYGIQANTDFTLGFRLSPFFTVESVPPGGTTPDFQVLLVSMGGYSSTAQLSCQGLPVGATCLFGGTNIGVTPGGLGRTSLVIQTTSNVPIGSYPFQLKATDSSVSDQITLTLDVADFGVSLAPTSQTVPTGHGAIFNMTLTSIAGWQSPVTVACSVSPASGGVCDANGLGFGPPGTFPITIESQSAPGGTYTVNLSATGQGVTHQTSATLIVQAGLDYSLNLAPSTQTIPAGTAASYSFTMGALGGWVDPVNVTCTVAPSNGGTCSANGKAFTPGTQTVTIQSQSAPAGTYTVSLSATGDGVTHQTSATFSVQGVSGTFSSNQATIAVGTSANFNFTLNSLGGTTGQFTFSCLNAPVGVSCGFNPTSGTLPANGTLGSTLTVTVSSRPALVAPPASDPSRPLLPMLLLASILCLSWLAITFRGNAPTDSGRSLIRVWASAPRPLVLILALCLAGCSGHGTAPPPPPPPLPVTVILGVQASSTATGNQQIGSITITVP